MGKLTTLSELQLDAIGEIMNISMGSAATAVSELLNAKVWITTPKVTVVQASELNYDRLEPAICVKIEYIKGLSGSNLMILKQDDVQLILNQLMGKPPVISPDFEFDELNISAIPLLSLLQDRPHRTLQHHRLSEYHEVPNKEQEQSQGRLQARLF